MRERSRQRTVPPKLFALRDQFVAVAGTIASVTAETNEDARKIDHVWIEVAAGEHGLVQIALSTRSRKSAEAGYDSRVWLGVLTSTWSELPAAGVQANEPFNYGTVTALHPIDFIPFGRTALEELLVQKACAACFARGWGEFYVRAHLGIHQVHSRRASLAHHADHHGKDGALELYFEDERRLELLLFKFAGQA